MTSNWSPSISAVSPEAGDTTSDVDQNGGHNCPSLPHPLTSSGDFRTTRTAWLIV
jgi:hypothetical protein